jgi:lysophospholipase L1-like esterase
VVFLGASTTEYWGVAEPGLFSGNVINRGIGGQTTQQLLLRFSQDVLSLRPRVLHLMASSNDIIAASGPGGVTPETVQQAIETMVTLAREHKITVVLASNFPTSHIPWAPGLTPAPLVIKWNAWLKEYAQTKGLAFVDYHAALRDETGGIPAALANDGVHPNRDGYARITPIARAAIARALGNAEANN